MKEGGLTPRPSELSRDNPRRPIRIAITDANECFVIDQCFGSLQIRIWRHAEHGTVLWRGKLCSLSIDKRIVLWFVATVPCTTANTVVEHFVNFHKHRVDCRFDSERIDAWRRFCY